MADQAGIRMIISDSDRQKAEEAGMESAFISNGHREVNYTTESLIKVAIEAAIDSLEYNLLKR